MLTLNANWLAAFSRADVKLRFLVTIEDGTNTWKALDGLHDTLDYPPSVLTVSQISAQLNPLTRNVQIGQVDVEMEDAFLREPVIDNQLINKKVTIQIGTADLVEGDFENYFRGLIGGILSDGKAQVIKLECLDVFEFFGRFDRIPFGVAKHPLEAVEDLASFIPAELIDSVNLDPSQSQYAEISHLVVSRKGWQTNVDNEAAPVFDLIGELSELLMGFFFVNESGKLGFKIYDPLAATVVTWDRDTIEDFDVRELNSNLVNVFNAYWGIRGIDGTLKQGYTKKDQDSIDDYKYPGFAVEQPRDYTLNSLWLWHESGLSLHEDADINSTTTSFKVFGAPLIMSGTRGMAPDGSQPADAQVSTSRPAWIRIDNEIMKVTAITPEPDAAFYMQIFNPNDGFAAISGNLPIVATLTVVRGQKGTTPQGHSRSLKAVIDITVPIYLADKLLPRFKDGVIILQLTTTFDQFAVQIGDLVRLDWPEFVAFGFNGTRPTVGKWEIVGKEPRPYNDPPDILWQVASVPVVFETVTPITISFPTAGEVIVATTPTVVAVDNIENYVSEGFGVSVISGFDIQVDPGRILGNNVVGSLLTSAGPTLRASKDSYLYADPLSKGVTVLDVANAAPAPTAPDGAALIAVVVTDGSGVVSIDSSEKPERALDGDKLVALTVAYGDALNVETSLAISLIANSDFGSFSKDR